MRAQRVRTVTIKHIVDLLRRSIRNQHRGLTRRARDQDTCRLIQHTSPAKLEGGGYIAINLCGRGIQRCNQLETVIFYCCVRLKPEYQLLAVNCHGYVAAGQSAFGDIQCNSTGQFVCKGQIHFTQACRDRHTALGNCEVFFKNKTVGKGFNRTE